MSNNDGLYIGVLVALMWLLIVAAILGGSFLITAGMCFGIAWAFGFVMTWKIAFGVWLALAVLKGVLKVTK